MTFFHNLINRSILILFLLISLIPNVSAVAVINTTQLTNATVAGFANPAWSPDEKKIVLNKNATIYIMNVDSSNMTSTEHRGYYAKWSSDGSKIVFERDNSIYIMNSNGSNEKKLISLAGSPDISPDSRYIAFDGGAVKGIGGTPEQGRGIFIMDIDGTNVKILTDDFGNELYPSWSPDGKKIVFTKGGIIHIMNTDGSNMINTGQEGTYARWSPNGNYIAFLSERAGNRFLDIKLDHIYIMDIDGTNVTQLTFGNNRWDWSFDLSPDGTKIVSGSDIPPDSRGNIYIMTLDFNVTSATATPTATQTPVVTSIITSTATSTATSTPAVPGFSLLSALVCLFILILVKRRR